MHAFSVDSFYFVYYWRLFLGQTEEQLIRILPLLSRIFPCNIYCLSRFLFSLVRWSHSLSGRHPREDHTGTSSVSIGEPRFILEWLRTVRFVPLLSAQWLAAVRIAVQMTYEQISSLHSQHRPRQLHNYALNIFDLFPLHHYGMI